MKTMRSIIKNIDMYLMILPAFCFLVVFAYIPMYGIVIAFKDFNIFEGVMASPWVGFKHFQRLFETPKFWEIFRNTLIISIMKLTFYFPFPIVLALALNEIRNRVFKVSIQTISYIPHFISWVIAGALAMDILSLNYGIVNAIIKSLGFEPIYFIVSPSHFRWVLVFLDIWKSSGWGAIVYIAAISSINTDLYEAATVDGAGKLRQMWHITLPGIRSTIVVLLLLRLGNLMEAGHEQIMMLLTPAVYDIGDIISTYVYRMGIGRMQYSFTTAVNLFRNIIGCALLFSANYFVKKLGEPGII
ncbi:MAG: ABC transporter permease subunit [Oscillospiraceae bacterium]|nr:ABC transporter permease subunit [Oscillospiraceae bacterium]